MTAGREEEKAGEDGKRTWFGESARPSTDARVPPDRRQQTPRAENTTYPATGVPPRPPYRNNATGPARRLDRLIGPIGSNALPES
jgi:hypothetical protein